MRHKVERIATSLVRTISDWGCCECITVGENAEKDLFDPGFALILDVYVTGGIPEPEDRADSFGNPGAFENAPAQAKDRFFLEEVPIRVEYKQVGDIGKLLDNSLDFLKILKNSGTYPLYRLKTAQILFNRTGWIFDIRSGLENLGDRFWEVMHLTFLRKMEHYYSDLGESVATGDDFYYMVSAAGFLRFSAATLFMANKVFEPSHRDIDGKLHELPRVPEDFLSAWAAFIAPDTQSVRTRQLRIAELMARKLVAFPREP